MSECSNQMLTQCSPVNFLTQEKLWVMRLCTFFFFLSVWRKIYKLTLLVNFYMIIKGNFLVNLGIYDNVATYEFQWKENCSWMKATQGAQRGNKENIKFTGVTELKSAISHQKNLCDPRSNQELFWPHAKHCTKESPSPNFLRARHKTCLYARKNSEIFYLIYPSIVYKHIKKWKREGEPKHHMEGNNVIALLVEWHVHLSLQHIQRKRGHASLHEKPFVFHLNHSFGLLNWMNCLVEDSWDPTTMLSIEGKSLNPSVSHSPRVPLAKVHAALSCQPECKFKLDKHDIQCGSTDLITGNTAQRITQHWCNQCITHTCSSHWF